MLTLASSSPFGTTTLVFALQAVGSCFGHLHGTYSFKLEFERFRFDLPAQHLRKVRTAPLVRAEGLEPPRLASLEPKSSASTNSATPAKSLKVMR